MDKNCKKSRIKESNTKKLFRYILVIFMIFSLIILDCNVCFALNKIKIKNIYSEIINNANNFFIKLWISRKYKIAVKHPASLDIDMLLRIGEEVLNKPQRQGFNKDIYQSMLIGPVLITQMTDDDIIKSMEYEKSDWLHHCNYIANPPKKWHIVIDARPYINDISNQSCVVFYLLNYIYCDTMPCSICGDGSRYWSLKKEALKRGLSIP